MKFFEAHKNVESGQCYNAWARIQVRWTAYFVGVGLMPKGWQGLHFGFFAPAHSPKCGYRLVAFYAKILPAMPGPVVRWPSWYRWVHGKLSARMVLAKGYV
jgi:hypothetical protein